MDLGSRLRELRNEKGYTQKELGDKLHLSRQSISKWENNNSLPDINTLILLADIYDMSVVDILGEKSSTLFTSEVSLDDSEKEHVLSFNDERRREEVMEKKTKRFLAVSSLFFLLVIVFLGGLGVYDDCKQKREDESFKINLYGVSDIGYGSEKNILGLDMKYVKEITLHDGTVVKNPTFEEIKERNLLEKKGEGVKVYKGNIINYYADSDAN